VQLPLPRYLMGGAKGFGTLQLTAPHVTEEYEELHSGWYCYSSWVKWYLKLEMVGWSDWKWCGYYSCSTKTTRKIIMITGGGFWSSKQKKHLYYSVTEWDQWPLQCCLKNTLLARKWKEINKEFLCKSLKFIFEELFFRKNIILWVFWSSSSIIMTYDLIQEVGLYKMGGIRYNPTYFWII
jgi:hypothetical protein